MSTHAMPSNTQITRWVLIIFILGLTLLAMWLIRDILMLTLTAVIFSVLLTSPVRFFVRLGVSRPVAVFITLILVILLIFATVLLIMPGLWDQFRQLLTQYIPDAAARIQQEITSDNLTRTFPFLADLPKEELDRSVADITRQVLGGIATISTQIFPFVGGLASTLLSILIVIFLALYFVADPRMHERGMLKLLPLRYRPRAREILAKLDLTLRNFLQAQIVLMLLSGVSTALMLLLFSVPLAGALGTITGLVAFVPNFGPLVALIPIIAVTIINTPQNVGLVILVFYVIQFVQSQLITPLLMGQEVNLPPAVILLSQIIAGIFFGFLGLLLSVPLAAILIVLVKEIYIKDILGDTDSSSSESAVAGKQEASRVAAGGGDYY